MTLHSLEIFIAVASNASMSEAARTLHIAQPTISQAVAELENEYGVRLFERLNRRLIITQAGEQLLSYARRLLSLADEMNRQMLHASVHKTILLGATMTVGKCVLADVVRLFESDHPYAQIVVTIENTATIERMLISGQLDIGLVEGDIKSRELIEIPAIPDELVLACHRNHPFALRDSVALQDLADQPFLLREEGSGTRELFFDQLRLANVRVKPKWTCHGSDSILEALLANQGLSVLSQRLVEPYVHAGALRIVPITGVHMRRYFRVVHHKTKYISDALSDLIAMIQKTGDSDAPSDLV